MQQRSYTHFGDTSGMTYGVQLLLILNIAAFIVSEFKIFPLGNYFALQANWWNHLGIWELITYQFLHADFRHIIFNMLMLFFIGPEVERGVGTKRFFILYFLSGILGGLGWSLLSPYGTCVGASGAVFGVLGAFAILYPQQELRLLICPFMPIKAWILVSVLISYEFVATLAASHGWEGRIANAAHLSGGLAGAIYTLVIDRPDIMRKIRRTLEPKEPEPISRAAIDRILDKASKHGIQSLTAKERETLKRAGKK